MAGFDFKTPFDDDSHTFQDGVLQRAFRMRKWMFANAALLIVLSAGWMNYSKTVSALGLDFLPELQLRQVLTITRFYLLLQFALVAYQLFVAYPESLRDRFRSFTSSSERLATEDLDKLQNEYVELRRIHGDPPIANLIANAHHDRMRVLALDVVKARQALIEATAAQVGARMAVRRSEMMLDAIRIAPGPVFLSVALFNGGVDLSRLLVS